MPPPGLPPGARRVFQQGNEFYVVGDERHPLRDAYHTFLKAPWWASFSLIAIGFFAVNVVFALVYMVVGGVDGTDGGFMDALSFSVQTLATIGYGVMHPQSAAADAVMIVESITSIIVTALATGLVFAKFSRPTARVAFSSRAVITAHEGKRTLMFRVGNRRSNIIVEATVHVVAMRTTTTAEGGTFYRATDLALLRDRQVGMTRGWTVMHVIDAASPLYGMDRDALAKAELELYIALTGIDDVTIQTVHAVHMYHDHEILVDHHFEDTLKTVGDTFLIDMTKFHACTPDA